MTRGFGNVFWVEKIDQIMKIPKVLTGQQFVNILGNWVYHPQDRQSGSIHGIRNYVQYYCYRFVT